MIVSGDTAELYSAVASGVRSVHRLHRIAKRRSDRGNPAIFGRPRRPSTSPATLIALAGLLIIGALICARVNAAILIGVLATWLLAAITGQANWQPQPYSVREIASTAFTLDTSWRARPGLLEIVFVFLFVDLFDNLGTWLPSDAKLACSKRQRNPSPEPYPLISDASRPSSAQLLVPLPSSAISKAPPV